MSIVVLISGRGSNLRALVAAGLPVVAVVSTNAAAAGLEFARAQGLPALTILHGAHSTRDAFDDALAAAIDRFNPRLVALAGFMRILTPGFAKRYAERLLNIHPSLLPAFPGLRTHARAIESGAKIHGCTVHFVTAELDQGPIVIQAAVPVKADDDEDRLAARVLAQEHRIYPLAVRWFLDGKLVIEDSVVRVREPGARQWLLADE